MNLRRRALSQLSAARALAAKLREREACHLETISRQSGARKSQARKSAPQKRAGEQLLLLLSSAATSVSWFPFLSERSLRRPVASVAAPVAAAELCVCLFVIGRRLSAIGGEFMIEEQPKVICRSRVKQSRPSASDNCWR